MRHGFRGLVTALLVSVAMAPAGAATITLSDVFGGTGFNSFTMDPTTGAFYRKTTYAASNTLTAYANRTDFENQTSSGSVTLSPFAAGPYITVNDGNLYARTQATTAASPITTGVWDIGTGSQTTGPTTIGTVGGGNQGFDWGGYSNGNFLQDDTGVYYLGSTTNVASNIWEIHKVDENLNSVASHTIDITGIPQSGNTNPGFAFMMGGVLFLGESYNSDFITGRFDFATNTLTTASYEVDGAWGSSYWNNTFYDPNDDVLYFNNTHGRLYKVESAKAAFDVAAVPAPASLLMFGFGLAALARRRVKH